MSARYHQGFYISDNFTTDITPTEDSVESVCKGVSKPKNGLSKVARYHPSLGGIGPVVKDQHGAYMKTDDVYELVAELRYDQYIETDEIETKYKVDVAELRLCRQEDQTHFKKLLRAEEVNSNIALLCSGGLLLYIFLQQAGVI